MRKGLYMISRCRVPASVFVRFLLAVLLIAFSTAWVAPASGQNAIPGSIATATGAGSTANSAPRMRGTTNEQRKAAAAHTAVLRAAEARNPHANAIVGTPGNPA